MSLRTNHSCHEKIVKRGGCVCVGEMFSLYFDIRFPLFTDDEPRVDLNKKLDIHVHISYLFSFNLINV